jgi:hypothetical protein
VIRSIRSVLARAACLAGLLELGGCPKSESDKPNPPASASAESASTPATSAPAVAAASVSAATPTGAHEHPVTFGGTYTSVATDGLDAGWTPVNFRGEDASTGLGSGKVELVVDFATNRVTGTVDGPVGPAVISGFYDSKTGDLNGTVQRKEPGDDGLSGSLLAKIPASRDAVTGKLQLSSGRANVLRVATFEAKPTAAP